MKETDPENPKVNLERQVGKRVRLRLVSGQDVEGTVVKVGAAAVQIPWPG